MEVVPFNFELPKQIHQALKLEAVKSGVSMRSLINHLLEVSVRSLQEGKRDQQN